MSSLNVGPLSNARLSYLFILVHDFDRMLQFYRDVLGFSAYYLEEGRCAFLNAGLEGGPAIAIYAGRESQVSGDSHWLIAFDVENLDSTVEALRARGAVVGDIVEQSFGRYAKFPDPEGNQLEVHEASNGVP